MHRWYKRLYLAFFSKQGEHFCQDGKIFRWHKSRPSYTPLSMWLSEAHDHVMESMKSFFSSRKVFLLIMASYLIYASKEFFVLFHFDRINWSRKRRYETQTMRLIHAK